MPKAQETGLEIDLKALKHNFEYLKSRTQKGTKTLAVVKAFGYGSDAVQIAKFLEEKGSSSSSTSLFAFFFVKDNA